MPPPNITGILHMGHAMFTTLQDILIRYHRMQGYNTLWLPGTDHAGLATQEKLDAEMIEQGLDPNGPEFEAFAEDYKKRIGGTINDQLRRTGASCDWSRYRFTLDEGYSKSVEAAFELCRDDMFERDGQLYLDMTEPAAQLLKEIAAGNLRIIPESETKTLIHFLENIEPWCISRQIRWGHKIPNSDDVLDTWFSSALWPFATLGWPEQTDDLKTFYPATLIETADDILFFWCARMLMMGLKLTGQMAFNTIYLHGILRDEHGRKLSKSLGNGIDPLDIIDKYGCDAMRMALAEGATPGIDSRLYDEKFEAAKSLRTKLWNASKFCLRHYIDEHTIALHPDDKEMLHRTATAKHWIGTYIEGMEIHQAAQEARRFLYDDFCSWYIEAAKDRLYEGDLGARRTLSLCFDELLRIMHPFMPFITEEIRSAYSDQPLITARWNA